MADLLIAPKAPVTMLLMMVITFYHPNFFVDGCRRLEFLLVEDVIITWVQLQKRLEESGCEGDCSDGRDRLETFQKSMYDICLLDVVMPRTEFRWPNRYGKRMT